MSKKQLTRHRELLMDVLFEEIQQPTGQGCRGFEGRWEYVQRMYDEGLFTDLDLCCIQLEVLA